MKEEWKKNERRMKEEEKEEEEVGEGKEGVEYLVQSSFEPRKHTLLYNERFIVKIFDYVVVWFLVYLEDDGFDRRVAFYQNAYKSMR